jgi:hypothetical protein
VPVTYVRMSANADGYVFVRELVCVCVFVCVCVCVCLHACVFVFLRMCV